MILCTLLAATCGSLGHEPIVIREVLAIESVGERSRSALNTDALEYALALGTWVAPKLGDKLTSTTGEERTWSRFTADENGSFSGACFRGGWAYASVVVPESGSWRLDVNGPSTVIVDGEPHCGDGYGLGITSVPLYLKAGPHDFLFRTGRGNMKAKLEPAPSTVYLEERDRTLPDVLLGEGGRVWLGTIVSNAGADHARGYSVRATAAGAEAVTVELHNLLPSSMRKCALPILVPANPEGKQVELHLELLSPTGDVVHESSLNLRVREPRNKHVRTFLSDIDDSVQYFGVTPPSVSDELQASSSKALILTLHGAGVEGKGHAERYEPKDWTYVIAPTNRRPFGFDWEDWGRMDALEVLQIARDYFGTDVRRTYLTGHSMGGHGTWQIGAHFPDLFAAIAPSAGWRDFWQYSGAVELDAGDAVSEMMLRSTNGSRTLLLKDNYQHGGVYILHGDADNNVPVSEARAMRALLAKSHPNFAYYERPGAGHWWGDECLDWKPLIEFLKANRKPAQDEILAVDFTTINPGISSRCDWVHVEVQERALMPSHVHATYDKETGVFQVEAENVSRLKLDLKPFFSGVFPSSIHIGDAELSLEAYMPTYEISLARDISGAWTVAPPLSTEHKNPLRSGPFKDAFRNRMVFVYGTTGTAEENAWSLSKARYDHEVWRYRGNGAVDVLADKEFEPAAYADRGVVLYGNADTNSAFERVLSLSAIDLRRDFVRIGDVTWRTESATLLAIRPSKDSAIASVAIVGGTGIIGCRTTDFRSYFVSGVGYPDWTVLGASSLLVGIDGIAGAGFFGSDWSARRKQGLPVPAEKAWQPSKKK